MKLSSLCSLMIVLTGAMAILSSAKLLSADEPAAFAEPSSDVELNEALAELERVHVEHYQVLAAIRDKVPPQAQAGIDRAIENSRRGWERARAARQRVQGRGRRDGAGNGRGGRPDGVGQGNQGGRPDGVGQGYRGGRPEGVGQAGRGGRPDGAGQGGRGGRPDGVGQGGSGGRVGGAGTQSGGATPRVGQSPRGGGQKPRR